MDCRRVHEGVYGDQFDIVGAQLVLIDRRRKGREASTKLRDVDVERVMLGPEEIVVVKCLCA